MRFEITHRIHFGYMREPGVYGDLTEADARNLSAPRPGLPNGYGRYLPTPSEMTEDLKRDIVDQAVAAGAPPLAQLPPAEEPTEQEPTGDPNQDTAPEPATDDEPPTEEVPATRSDDPSLGPVDSYPSLLCRGCEHKPFKSKAARDAHEKQKHERVLN